MKVTSRYMDIISLKVDRGAFRAYPRYGRLRRELHMPLVKGAAAKSRKGFSENIRRERASGKPLDQSIAIAYSEAGEKKRKKK